MGIKIRGSAPRGAENLPTVQQRQRRGAIARAVLKSGLGLIATLSAYKPRSYRAYRRTHRWGHPAPLLYSKSLRLARAITTRAHLTKECSRTFFLQSRKSARTDVVSHGKRSCLAPSRSHVSVRLDSALGNLRAGSTITGALLTAVCVVLFRLKPSRRV